MNCYKCKKTIKEHDDRWYLKMWDMTVYVCDKCHHKDKDDKGYDLMKKDAE